MSDNNNTLNIPRLNFKDFVDVVSVMPPNISVLCFGDHGIGKSAAVKAIAKKMGVEMRDVRLAGRDPGDIIGLPEKVKTADGNHTVYNTPSWFPLDENWDGIIHFDEFNRAHKDVRNGMFQIVYDKQLYETKLPAKARTYICSNYGEDYEVDELDPAFVDRFFVCVFDPTVDEWLAWGREEGNVHPSVLQFIAVNKSMLDGKAQKGFCTPTRRSWDRLSQMLVSVGDTWKERVYMFAAGCLGSETALLFDKYVKEQYREVTGEEVVNNFDKVKWDEFKNDLGIMTSITDNVVKYIKNKKMTDKQIENIKKFLLILKPEIINKFYKEHDNTLIYDKIFVPIMSGTVKSQIDADLKKVLESIVLSTKGFVK